MANQDAEQDYIGSILAEFNTKIRDFEEKNRIMKERILLIGQNLVDIRVKNNQDMLGMKKDLEVVKMEIKRIKSFVESAASEITNFAKKSELAVLSKQAKIFQPTEFVRKQDLERQVEQILQQKLKALEGKK